MKKQVSTLSLIALAAFSIWQYFTEHKKDTKPAPKTTQQQSQSAVKNTKDFGNYDVIMRDDAIGQNKNAPVDYYMLALSWSPAFSEILPNTKCGKGNKGKSRNLFFHKNPV